MKRLHLLRHARASNGPAGSDDHARELDDRGREEAAQLATRLDQLDFAPSLVLCSSARRAVATLECLRAQLPPQAGILIERGLYLAAHSTLLERIGSVDPFESGLLVIAHNPGVAELANLLAANGEIERIERMRVSFPPGSLAAFSFGPAP